MQRRPSCTVQQANKSDCLHVVWWDITKTKNESDGTRNPKEVRGRSFGGMQVLGVLYPNEAYDGRELCRTEFYCTATHLPYSSYARQRGAHTIPPTRPRKGVLTWSKTCIAGHRVPTPHQMHDATAILPHEAAVGSHRQSLGSPLYCLTGWLLLKVTALGVETDKCTISVCKPPPRTYSSRFGTSLVRTPHVHTLPSLHFLLSWSGWLERRLAGLVGRCIGAEFGVVGVHGLLLGATHL